MMSPDTTKPTHAGLIVFNLAGQVLLVSGLKATLDEWLLPKGKIEPHEEPCETAERETREEAGISASVTSSDPVAISEYDYKNIHVVVGWYSGLAHHKILPSSMDDEQIYREPIWESWENAIELLTFEDQKWALRQALCHQVDAEEDGPITDGIIMENGGE